jgi:anti-anti-sigma factor
MTLSLFLNTSRKFPCPVTEVAATGKLVRGCESTFVDQLLPRARKESLLLNLSAVSQIDAAGIAALIALYRTCNESGYQLTVVEPSEHVHEVLHLVGLEHLLIVDRNPCGADFGRATLTAA